MSEERVPCGFPSALSHGDIVDAVTCPGCGGHLRADDRFELSRLAAGPLQRRELVFWSTTCTGCGERCHSAAHW